MGRVEGPPSKGPPKGPPERRAAFEAARSQHMSDLPEHYPPYEAFPATEAVPYWSQERDGRMMRELANPEVARPPWLGTAALAAQRVAYWQRYASELAASDGDLAFSEADVGTEVAFRGFRRATVQGRSVRLSPVERGERGLRVRVVESVVPETGGLVVFRDGTVVENRPLRRRRTPPFKYVDQQTPEEPEWTEERDGARFREVRDRPHSYEPFATDKAAAPKVKLSKYTRKLRERFGLDRTPSIEERAELTGVPLGVLRRVNAKGLAAWRTGHRPGASQRAWGSARVNSFLQLGCTVFANDDRLAEEAAQSMSDERLREWTDQEVMCPEFKLRKAYYRRTLERLRGTRFLGALCASDKPGRDLICESGRARE